MNKISRSGGISSCHTALDTLAWLIEAAFERDRLTNWGEWLPTRAIIRIMIAHDFYHAGEINHLRALIQGTDSWPY